MKIWLLMKRAYNEPRQSVYILGAHSSHEAAIKHQKEVDEPSLHTTHLIEMDVDKKQPPVLIGIASDEPFGDCKKNLPHG